MFLKLSQDKKKIHQNFEAFLKLKKLKNTPLSFSWANKKICNNFENFLELGKWFKMLLGLGKKTYKIFEAFLKLEKA